MKFSDILGQQTAKKFLRQVMITGKIPHAYLFTGISGIGKTSTAMAFAMALNCRAPIDHDGCGNCPSCRQLLGNNFADFQSIRPENQNILIDQIKELNRSLSFAPLSGGYRVSVIHQAETMTDEAANSFLKTLEEPLPGNILILKVNEPLDLLPTIVSRCQQVPFHPLPALDIKDWLVKEKMIDSETAALLAGVSAGSLGRALRMADSDFLEKRKKWLSDLMRIPGMARQEALTLALECAEEDKKKGIDLNTPEVGLMDMLSVWANWYRDLLIVRVNGPGSLLTNFDFSIQLKKMADRFTINNLTESIRTLFQAQMDIRRMRNVTLVMEHTVTKLTKL